MTEIKSLGEFSDMLSSFRKEHKKSETNFLMMPAQISEFCQSGSIFASQSGGFLKILCNMGDYFSLYYYCANDETELDIADVKETAKDKDVLLDFVLSEKRQQTVGFPITALVQSKKLKEYKTYKRMDFDLLFLSSAQKIELADGFSENSNSALLEIINLWKEALDERSTPLPAENEILQMRKDGNIISVSAPDGNLAAVGILSVSGRQGIIQHIAVSPLCRRKGLARYVVNKLLFLAKEKNIRVLRLWVDKENLPAVTLYNSLGFKPDAIICKQYILN